MSLWLADFLNIFLHAFGFGFGNRYSDQFDISRFFLIFLDISFNSLDFFFLIQEL